MRGWACQQLARTVLMTKVHGTAGTGSNGNAVIVTTYKYVIWMYVRVQYVCTYKYRLQVRVHELLRTNPYIRTSIHMLLYSICNLARRGK